VKTRVVALVSGGMDSVAALYLAHQQYVVDGAVSFDYSSKHNHREIAFAAWHCEKLCTPHRTIALDFVGSLFKSDLLKSGGAIPDGHGIINRRGGGRPAP
jgi:7-cyano-7-deazaguanine synthase